MRREQEDAEAGDPTGAVSLATTKRVQSAINDWNGQLIDLGGRNTLLYYRGLNQGTLDLGAEGSNPVAVESVLAGHTVHLSDLFDVNSVGAAVRRARTVRAKATENLEERGLHTLYLACGMATWTNTRGSGSTPAAPIMLCHAQLSARRSSRQD